MLRRTTKAIGCCIAFLSVFVAWGSGAQEAVYHDNVVILLDTSGSMDGEMKGTKKIDAAKSALKEILKQIPETTEVGLLVFNSPDSADDWIYPLGPREDEKLLAAIDRPRPSGGTPLGVYIKKGADRLLERRQAQYGYGTYRLLVVTDGEAQDQDLVDRFSPEVMARGITLDVIGVDMRQNHTLARIAHSYRRADDPDSLRQAIAEVFAEVSSSGDRAAGEEAFDLLAPLPVEAAEEMVRALVTSGNEPIGSRSVRAPLSQVIAQHPSSQPSTSSSPAGTGGRRSGNTRIWIFVIACVILYSLSKMKRKKRT